MRDESGATDPWWWWSGRSRGSARSRGRRGTVAGTVDHHEPTACRVAVGPLTGIMLHITLSWKNESIRVARTHHHTRERVHIKQRARVESDGAPKWLQTVL